MFTLNCRGKLFFAEYPQVMGIVNITPDSFYTGSTDPDYVLQMVHKMTEDGASIIDIGGQSTKPGSEMISADEEMSRVIPILEKLTAVFTSTIFSIDTFYSSVAEAAVVAGASIVNDVSSGSIDPDMIRVVGKLQVPYIAMHMQGTPASMQKDPFYEDVVKDVLDYFIYKLDECKTAGIIDVILDPGFGFGKKSKHNFSLLKNLAVFDMLDRPILAGISRKGMVYRSLEVTAEHALNGTTALNMIALMNGAQILRVHDVKEACEAVTLYNIYKGTK